ncbi:MAG TPA: Sua5/YciO/YrdC/YwlC family protein, partial [Zeimonas sp.]|nr:Sua5/YciO/YrdC/YwlC family protein [Zeimonas sp.]
MRGELVVFPTETVYGLGADAANADAVAELYRIKQRPPGHPLIVHVLDDASARLWAEWPQRAQRLAEAFWPGPLTL